MDKSRKQNMMSKKERYKSEIEAFRRHLQNRSKKDVLERISNIRMAGFGGGPTIKDYFNSFHRSFEYLNNFTKDIPYKKISSCLRKFSVNSNFEFYKPPKRVSTRKKLNKEGAVNTAPFFVGYKFIHLT